MPRNIDVVHPAPARTTRLSRFAFSNTGGSTFVERTTSTSGSCCSTIAGSVSGVTSG
jgi:hypothetical protein